MLFYDRRTICKTGNSDPRCLLRFCLVSLLSVLGMSAPLHSSSTEKPRWINPCGITGHVFTENDMNGAPNSPLAELYANVIMAAVRARANAENAKKTFLSKVFPDPEFESGAAIYHQPWLPVLPSPTEAHFREMTREEAFRKSFEYMQYYGVGLEQILMDQTLHEGTFTTLFKEVENYLTQVLCELQLGMHQLKIQPSADVMRDVMSYEYRDISDGRARDMRDFLILRDYVQATNYIAELFAYLQNKL